jgi:hypothetical protein
MRPYVISGYEVPDIPYTEQEMEETKEKTVDYLNKAGEILRNKGATVTARVGVEMLRGRLLRLPKKSTLI